MRDTLDRRTLLALSAASLGSAAMSRPAFAQNAVAAAALPVAPVTVTTADGRAHVFRAEIAATPESTARGLMWRERLGADEAMLFVFPEEGPRAFWMRNTLIPLDILFFDAKGAFVDVAAEARPLDTTSLPSSGPAQFVLEINGGLAAKLGVGPGARLASPALADPRLLDGWPRKR